jgi:uncharacterized membrane protein
LEQVRFLTTRLEARTRFLDHLLQGWVVVMVVEMLSLLILQTLALARWVGLSLMQYHCYWMPSRGNNRVIVHVIIYMYMYVISSNSLLLHIVVSSLITFCCLFHCIYL